jgi:hypothetical protein
VFAFPLALFFEAVRIFAMYGSFCPPLSDWWFS